MTRSIFGEAVDCAQASVVRGKWAFFQPRSVVMAPTGAIHFHPDADTYRDDFSRAPLNLQGLFIHEMTHVWQTQTRGRWWLPLMRHPFCRYEYRLGSKRSFGQYGIEQQAEIVRHAYLSRCSADATGRNETLERLLPFGPRRV